MRSIERPGASYGLPPRPALRYSPPAAAKSAAGRRNPCISKATQHAPGVFFYVAAFACSFFARWMLCYRSSQSMVAQAGQPSGWPVFLEAGIPTPVWATTHKCRNFGGSNNLYSKEA
ncbi:TPA: ash family protein, partial [Serratia marcescens]|nr:ash family protein [Serratia marcescens]